MKRILERARNRKEAESGVAMIIAVMVVLVMVAIITFMTAYAMRSIEKGTTVQNLNASLNAADTAVANMMSVANGSYNAKMTGSKELDKYLGPLNAVRGSFTANETDPENGDGKYGWEWYAEKQAGAATGTSYIVYATGYPLKNVDPSNTELTEARNLPDARTVKVTITSSTVEEIVYESDGSVNYVATTGGTFAYPVFANTTVDIGNNATINTYDSYSNLAGYPLASNKLGEPATNGNITVGSGTGVTKATMFRSTTGTAEQALARCSGAGCASLQVNMIRYGMLLNYSRQEALDACPKASYPDWVASANGGAIPKVSGPQCYNNIVFDVDTDIHASYTTGNPALVYAKGSVKVSPGVEVNRQRQASKGPLSLRIVSTGSTDFTMTKNTTANPTKFSGVIVGNGLNCDIGGSSASGTHGTALYGSVACAKVNVRPGSSVYWDTQLDKTLGDGSATSQRIWTPIEYEEL